jgi:phospholipid transport system substrate-binding protein
MTARDHVNSSMRAGARRLVERAFVRFAITSMIVAAPVAAMAQKPSVASVTTAPGKGAAGATPTAQIRSTNERIDRVLKSKKDPEDAAAKAEMRSIVGGFLDFQELARRSLSAHWDKLSPPQREEFVKTLREMIEKKYERQLKSPPEYTIKYGDETRKGDDATVPTMLKVKTKGKSTETAIDYKMHKSGERWLVYDMITDEVSMVRTYREQFDKIIRQESFDALLRKMRKRIQETENGDDGKTASAK